MQQFVRMGLNETPGLHARGKLQLHTNSAGLYKFTCTQSMCTQ
jgi:hypothetical protein